MSELLAVLQALSPLPIGGRCAVLSLTGLPCPLCGMTRSTLALAHGDLAGAFGHHPLGPFLLLGLALALIPGRFRDRYLEAVRPRLIAIVSFVWVVNIVAH